jgi:hypothetical protein
MVATHEYRGTVLHADEPIGFFKIHRAKKKVFFQNQFTVPIKKIGILNLIGPSKNTFQRYSPILSLMSIFYKLLFLAECQFPNFFSFAPWDADRDKDMDMNTKRAMDRDMDRAVDTDRDAFRDTMQRHGQRLGQGHDEDKVMDRDRNREPDRET